MSIIPMKILITGLLCTISIALDCEVTLTMTFLQCQNYCLNKYGSSQAFFNQSSSTCLPYTTCKNGQSLNISSNSCFNGTKSNLTLSSTEVPDVVNGYLNSYGQAICNAGWTSSNYVQAISSSLHRRYYCDVEKIVGQIYPMSNGEYYFNLLENASQLAAIHYQFGVENYWDAIGITVFVIICVFVLFNIYECLNQMRRKIKRRFFKKVKKTVI